MNLLENEDYEYSNINFYGIGFIGKSTLLNEFSQICEKHAIFINIDIKLHRLSHLEILSAIREQVFEKLRERRSVNYFSNFDGNLKKFYALESRLQKSVAATESHTGAAVAKTTVESVSTAIGGALGLAGGPVGSVLGSGAGAMVGKAGSTLGEKALNNLLRKGFSVEDAKFYVDAIQILGDNLTKSLNDIASEFKLIIAFDTYEEITDALDGWIREQFLMSLDTEVYMIFSGRDKLTQINEKWRKFSDMTVYHELKEFTEPESIDYLSREGITEQKLQEKMVKLAGGLPGALALFSDLHKQSHGLSIPSPQDGADRFNIINSIAERLISQAKNENIRKTIQACAIVRKFDDKVLKFLLETDRIDEALSEIRKFTSFVKINSDKTFSLHDTAREFILENTRNLFPDFYLGLNYRAAEFYKSKLQAGDSSNWSPSVFEIVYHLLAYNEDQGIEYFKQVFFQIDSFRDFALRDALITEVINASFEKQENLCWQSFCKGYKDFFRGNWIPAETVLAELLKNEGDALLKASVVDTLGELYIGQGKYKAARSLYELEVKGKSMSVLSKENGIARKLSKLIEICAILSDYKAAIQYSEDLLQISQNDKIAIAWGLKGLGDTHRLWGKTDKAVNYFEDSLKVFEEMRDVYGIGYLNLQLGRVYTHKGKLEQATKALEKAAEIFSPGSLNVTYGQACSLLFLGNVFRFKNNLGKALDYYEQAFKVLEPMNCLREIGPLHGSIGIVLARLNKMPLAKEHLIKSLVIKRQQQYQRGVAVTSIYLGDYFFLQGNIKKAVKLYDYAIKKADATKSNYQRVEARIKLCQSFVRQNNKASCPPILEKAKALATRYRYYDQLARLCICQINLLLMEKIIDEDVLLRDLKSAFSYSFSYNNYCFEEIEKISKKLLDDYAARNPEKAKEIIASLESIRK